MKSILFTLSIMCSMFSMAQSISYDILEDNPEKAYTRFIAPEFGMEYNSTTLSVFAGANGRFAIGSKMTLESAARLDLYQLNGPGPGFHLEGGLFLPLTSKIKNKEVPVILSYDPYADTKYENGVKYNVEETKYIKIPNGQYLNTVGVRGGIYNRKTGAENLTEDVSSAIFLSGVYLGGQFTSQAYVKTRVNNDVERIGAGFSRFYGDLLILPVSNIDDPRADDGLKGDGVIGWRVGFQWYVSPHNGDYRFLGPSVFTAELGNRPLSGFLFNLSWGFAFGSS